MHPIITELKEIIRTDDLVPPIVLRSLLKEHLQNYVLDFIYESSKHKSLIFYGGTCLKKIYGLDRMSEDLDFETDLTYDSKVLAKELEGYFFKKQKFSDVEIKHQNVNNVNRITLKFPILNKLGLSENKNENLHIKLEINLSDNIDYPIEVSPLSISKFTIFVKHYDLSTLMAGKMVACIDRSFFKGKTKINIKGRDYYDLIWYMQKEVSPNLDRIRAYKKDWTVKKVFEELDKKVERINSKDLLIDLEPFFLKQGYIKTWSENFHSFYKKYRKNHI
jgi:predicted nucleotidyltransferase component of viral defense system